MAAVPPSDPPLPAIPDVPAALDAALLAEAAVPPDEHRPLWARKPARPEAFPAEAAVAPATQTQTRLPDRPWFKDALEPATKAESVAATPPPAQVTAETPLPATPPTAPLLAGWTPPPYAFTPPPADGRDLATRTLDFLDQIHFGRYLREFAGDKLVTLNSLRDEWREEIATRPGTPAAA